MPEFANLINITLSGVLGLLVWKTPEILAKLLEYLRERARVREEDSRLREVARNAEITRREDARNAEFTSLFQSFRTDLGRLQDTFESALTSMQGQWKQTAEAIVSRLEKLDGGATATAARLEAIDRHITKNREHMDLLQVSLEKLAAKREDGA